MDLSYYVGQTSDLEERLLRQNSGRERYTKSRVPWKLVYAEEYPTRMMALQRESEIKKKKSRIYVETLIRAKLELM